MKTNSKILIPITFIAFALRVYALDFQPLWGDEGWSFYFACMPIVDMIHLTALDIHPPLYYLILHGWFMIAGITSEMGRFVSVICGTLLIPIVYQLAHVIESNHTISKVSGVGGVLAAFITAINPMAIYYSQEVRMYGLVTLLGTMSMLAFVHFLRGNQKAKWAYIIVTTLSLYTMYYAIFIVIAQGIYVLIRATKNWRVKAFMIKPDRFLETCQVLNITSFVTIGLLYSPWVIYATDKLMAYIGQKVNIEGYTSLTLAEFLTRYALAFSVGHPLKIEIELLTPITILFIMIAMLGTWNRLKCSTNNFKGLVLLYLFIPLLLGWLINLVSPFTPRFFERTLLIAAPAWWLLVAAGLAKVKIQFFPKIEFLQTSIIGLFLVGINMYSLFDFYQIPRYPDEDYRPLLAKVSAIATHNDIIMASYQWQLGYYHAYLAKPHPQFYIVPAWGNTWGNDSAIMRHDLTKLLQHDVWFPAHQTLGRTWETNAENIMTDIGFLTLLTWYDENTKLTLFAKQTTITPSQTIYFKNDLKLNVSLANETNFEAGRGIIPVGIAWDGLDKNQLSSYLVTLKLSDSHGEIWAKRDVLSPQTARFTEQHGLLVEAGTVPGSYEVHLSVSHASHKKPLDMLSNDGQPQGVEAKLMTINVYPAQTPIGKAALPVQTMTNIPFDDHVNLVGYTVGQTEIQAGETLPVNLFWQSMSDALPELTMFVQLQDEHGKAVALTEHSPIYPTTAWQSKTLLRDLHHVKIPADLPPKTYTLAIGVLYPNKTRLQTPFNNQFVLGKIKLTTRSHEFEAPSFTYPVEANFDNKAILIGYDISSTQLEIGDTLTLTMHWQSNAMFDRNWTIFAHVVDEDGKIIAQQDQLPPFPTTTWIPNEYISDTRYIMLKPDKLPGGNHTIHVGLYDADTFLRLPLVNGDDTFILSMPSK